MIVEQFKQLYQQLDASNVEKIETVYAPEIQFQDPFHQIDGLQNLKHYFKDLYLNVDTISFEFGESISDGNNHFVDWVMNLTHPKLNKGRTIKVPGATFLKVNETQQIISHRDFFDAGVMLYEQIPVLGGLVRMIKRRL
jgi:hypothetical protein